MAKAPISRCLLTVGLVVILAACSSLPVVDAPQKTDRHDPSSATLVVFAAASLIEPFTEIGQLFEREHEGVSVLFNFAGSQQLARQLEEGAPADVFASAGIEQMEQVSSAGRVSAGSPATFARNRLVVIYPGDNPAHLRSLNDLARPGMRVIMAAKEVPVGQYTMDFLAKADEERALGPQFGAKVLNNVVSYEENVKAVLNKVVLGEADAGIVYVSDVTGPVASRVGHIDIPDGLNSLASYPIAPIADTSHGTLAGKFIEIVLSPTGQDILARHGFIPAR